ncbi:hypothetical protein [Acidovorax sp. A1169]|uniref:hypothetical protein n=1 Tax=Acidovorax sp. A1169 TaxID=3059524 RepID=UPI002737C6C1|nr:hypothetical protein [Acidovorax sp. A1169]MDP4076328.1 hypothetical protein [Acidovorax sp. A1169]
MRALRAYLVVAAALLLSGAGHAACSEVWSGRSSTHEVTVSDGDCEYGKLMIGVNSLRPAKLPHGGAQAAPPGMLAFDSQCQLAPDLVSGFACRADGSTVLAGATYRRVPGRKKVCDDPRWPVYQCVKGCSQPGSPRVFRIEPYEC